MEANTEIIGNLISGLITVDTFQEGGTNSAYAVGWRGR